MAETPQGETGLEQPKNDVNNPVTPAAEKPGEKKPDAQVEQLRKEKEQAEMRANQLANQLKAKEDAEREAEEKRLEEENQYKDLYEKRDARVKELEAEADRRERETLLKAKAEEIYKDYPDIVREVAEDAELKLADTDEDSVEAFKKKLDNFKTKLGNAKVTPNNPGTPTPRENFNPSQYKDLARNPVKLAEHWSKTSPVMAAMIKPAE